MIAMLASGHVLEVRVTEPQENGKPPSSWRIVTRFSLKVYILMLTRRRDLAVRLIGASAAWFLNVFREELG